MNSSSLEVLKGAASKVSHIKVLMDENHSKSRAAVRVTLCSLEFNILVTNINHLCFLKSVRAIEGNQQNSSK